jgi:predicted small lipoprotein YifL
MNKILLVLCLLVFASCGTKGKLYMPKKDNLKKEKTI